MFKQITRLCSPTGASIAYRHMPAGKLARAILLICHGLAEHSGRYEEFATVMAGEGLHVFAHDHRGHGLTTAPDAPQSRFAARDGTRRVIDDVHAMRNLTASTYPGLPVILFGHSMGGLVALNAACDYPDDVQALAIWNSNLHPGLAGRLAQVVLRIEKALMGADVPSAILPRATFRSWGRSMPEKRTDADWLSSDRSEVDSFNDDPLCGFDASISLWIDLFEMTYRGIRDIDRLPKALPIHLAGGEQDPATNGGKEVLWLAERLDRHGLSQVTTKIWPATRHETLKERVRHDAMRQFATWTKAFFPETE